MTTFTASVLLDNAEMQKVFINAGLSVQRHLEDGVLEFTCALPRNDADPHWDMYLDAVAARERRADVASLRHVFAPGSVAVVGASRRTGTVGPGHPAQHRHRRLRRTGVRGQPARQHMEACPCPASAATARRPPTWP